MYTNIRIKVDVNTYKMLTYVHYTTIIQEATGIRSNEKGNKKSFVNEKGIREEEEEKR